MRSQGVLSNESISTSTDNALSLRLRLSRRRLGEPLAYDGCKSACVLLREHNRSRPSNTRNALFYAHILGV